MALTIRPATTDDILTLGTLIHASTRRLSRNDYSDEQIETALSQAMGVDRALIHDGTYFVAEMDDQIVACGGWSRRQRILGTDDGPGDDSSFLMPGRDAARVRAFYVHPDWARRGIGRQLLAHCEAQAREHGFTAVELLATLPGQRLYQACGYLAQEPVQYALSETLLMRLTPMRKELAAERAAVLAHSG